jgi:8-oxo-dGTP diphosphatase
MRSRALLFLVASSFIPVSAQLVFQHPPEHFQPKVEVAACFITDQQKFLFLKRLPHKTDGNCWGIPGGKVEQGETAEQAVIREIQEETGISLHTQPLTYFGKVYIRYPHVDFIYHMFEYQTGSLPPITISQEEHSEFRWLTLPEALELPLIPGEDECIYLCYGASLQENK